MSDKTYLATNLASAFLAGPWSAEELARRGARACGERKPWIRALALRVLAAFDRPTQVTHKALAEFIAGDPGFLQVWGRWRQASRLPLGNVYCDAYRMMASPWRVPELPTAAALADLLGLRPQELDWFADSRRRQAHLPDGPLRHYGYRWVQGRRGKWRLLEIPRGRLKALQRRVLHGILDGIPPHAAAHAYRRGRSVLSYAAPHAGRALVLHFDLRDFFPSVRAARVHALFRTAGYPIPVARLLTGLCTGQVPAAVLASRPSPATGDGVAAYQSRHLPQGAPTSPALANLCAYRLDCRLAGLAQEQGAYYTRYADDLAFSGDGALQRNARRLQVLVGRIALEEGFELNMRKTQFMRHGVRQQLAGIVLNAHPNLSRREYDRLKAMLHNCVVRGPDAQNRAGHADFRAHLAGRVAYAAMLNPARAQRLRELFNRIAWGATDDPMSLPKS